MKKIFIHGAYKGDNFGDTLLLTMLISKLQRDNIEIILSNTCNRTYAKCSRFKNIRVSNGIWDILSSSCIIFGGGGYFGEQPNNKNIWYLSFIKNHLLIGYLFILMRKPIAFIGVEFGELTNSLIRWLSFTLLKKAKVIGARNIGSYRWLLENMHSKNVILTADIALNISNFDNITECAFVRPEVLIHPSFDPKLDLPSSQMAKLLNDINWAELDIKLALILDRNNQQSKHLIKAWIDVLGRKIHKVYQYDSPMQLCEVINGSKCIISNKLHTTIVASAFGRCVISVAKHPKNKRFFEDIGRPDLNISHASFDLKEFEKLVKLFKDNELDPVSLSEEVRSRAIKNYELIDEFLEIV